MARRPVRSPARDNQLSFPLNQRVVVAGWKLLFLRHGPHQPDSTKSAEWNRGAYLVEGLAHCGACHTPRNKLGAEIKDQAFTGGEVEGWHAPALNSASPSPVPWTVEALQAYLKHGVADQHSISAGPMVEVVHGLSQVSDEAVRAIAAYTVSLDKRNDEERRRARAAAL